MEAGSSMQLHKRSPIIPILSQINPTPRIDADFFRTHPNFVLPFTLRPS